MFKEPNTLLQTSVETQPEFSKLLGISIISATEKQVRAELMVKKELANRNGVMHGGAIMGFADNIGGTATFLNLEPEFSATTIESKTNFLRPVRIGDMITAECNVINKGKKIVVLQTTVFRSDEKVAAIVTQTQLKLKFIKK